VSRRKRKGLFEHAFDRVDDADRAVRKVARRAVVGKRRKKSKKSGSKLARHNNEQLEALTEQVALLVRHLSVPTNGSQDVTRSLSQQSSI
jgi:hypothetical protein